MSVQQEVRGGVRIGRAGSAGSRTGRRWLWSIVLVLAVVAAALAGVAVVSGLTPATGPARVIPAQPAAQSRPVNANEREGRVGLLQRQTPSRPVTANEREGRVPAGR